MSETANVTRPIQSALEKAGYMCLRLNSGTAQKGKYFIKLCPKGTADLLLCLPGQLPIWLETKTADGHTNKAQVEAQAAFKAKVENLGHQYHKVHTLDDVLGILGRR